MQIPNQNAQSNEILQKLVGKCCWAVAWGPNTWTNMALKIGSQIPRTKKLKNETNPVEIRYVDSAFTVHVQGPWTVSIQRDRNEVVNAHSTIALALLSQSITNARLLAARIEPVFASFEFDNRTKLNVYPRKLFDESPEPEIVLTVFYGQKYFTWDSNNAIEFHSRRELK